MKAYPLFAIPLAIVVSTTTLSAAPRPICVSVEIKRHTDRQTGTKPGKNPGQVAPKPTKLDVRNKIWSKYGIRFQKKRYPYPPRAYLKRLIEHYVTHQKKFVAVKRGCTARIMVELYPLRQGWTVFVRYTGSKMEEKVDVLLFDEFSRFAERVVSALLYGKHLSKTANLKTILRSDSIRNYRTIKGSHHFMLALGSQFRLGFLPTAVTGGAENKFRFLSPLVLDLGYRGRFNEWGITSFVRGVVGVNKRSVTKNPEGGHTDLSGGFGLGIQFKRYHDPHQMISFYYGGGATFDLSFFSVIRALDARSEDDRDTIVGGGLNLDALIGVEFMRANAVQLFLQLNVSLPVYLFSSESRFASFKTWMPQITAQLGIMF